MRQAAGAFNAAVTLSAVCLVSKLFFNSHDSVINFERTLITYYLNFVWRSQVRASS
jgi:hypothetical protein